MDESWTALSDWWMDLPQTRLYLAVGIPVVAFFLKTWFGRLCAALISGFAQKFGIFIDEEERRNMVPANGALFVLFALYGSIALLEISTGPISILLNILSSLIVCCVFWLINSFLQIILEKTRDKGVKDDRFIGSWLSQIVRFVLLVLLIVVVLHHWGIQFGSALTGLGIAGAAAALATQDFIRNVIAGFSFASEGRFREGDWIRVPPDIEGIVEKVELKSTIIRRFDNGREHIPNAELAYKSLSNFTHRPARRLRWIIPLKLQTDADKLNAICEEITEYIDNGELFMQGYGTRASVSLHAFSTSSIDMLVDCYVATNEYYIELKTRHQLVMAIKETLEKHGSAFALPAQAVRLENEHVPGFLSQEEDRSKA